MAIVLAIVLIPSHALGDDESASAFSKIQPSLVLIATSKGGRLTKLGTGFAVANRDGRSLIVTNRHVISGGDSIVAVRQFPNSIALTLRVIRIGSQDDLALLESTSGEIPSVLFSSIQPQLGRRIAVAGYPRTQLAFAQLGLGLTPSIHAGTINALPAGGYYVQYDAQTEPGNSGGPLFDAITGAVYAVVVAKVKGANESNLAISASRLQAFVRNAHVALTKFDDTPSPIPTPSPEPTASIALGKCQAALTNFYAANSQLNEAFDRYIKAQASATSSARSATNRFAFAVAQVSASYEVRAIRSVIDAEEPKYSSPVNDVEQSGATETAQRLSHIVDDVHQRDQYAVSWSQSRYDLFSNLAHGGSGYQLDQSSLTQSNQLTFQIDHEFTDLKYSKPCRS